MSMTVNQQTPGQTTEIAAQQDPATGCGQIVVGVDGSAPSMTALAWALQEGRIRSSRVKVVMAWQQPQAYGAPNVWGLGMDPSFNADGFLSSAAQAQVARLAQQAGPSKGVQTMWEAIEGHPAEVLVEASEGADLLVVGSRGHGGFIGMLLGSVSQHVLAHARCPVVVIRDPQPHDADEAVA
jgi:nucleotide-binding universal stress UspA family protein